MSNYPDDINTSTKIVGSPFYIPVNETWSVHELECYQNDEGDWITESIGEATDYLTFNEDLSDPDIVRKVTGSNSKYLLLLTNRAIDLTREDDVIWIDDPNTGENLLQLHKVG